jgi:hypothetical protein
MFAVIYRSYLKPGREKEFQTAWKSVADYFIHHRGAIGSCLHRGEDGLWVAYSRWPNRECRDVSWPKDQLSKVDLPEEITSAIALLKDCIDEERKLPDLCLEVVDDKLC